MLAAEYETLPPQMRTAVVRFFEHSEVWLSRVLEEGRAAGELDFQGAAEEQAQLIVGGLEGSMVVARPYEDPDRFEHSAKRLVNSLLKTRSQARNAPSTVRTAVDCEPAPRPAPG